MLLYVLLLLLQCLLYRLEVSSSSSTGPDARRGQERVHAEAGRGRGVLLRELSGGNGGQLGLEQAGTLRSKGHQLNRKLQKKWEL